MGGGVAGVALLSLIYSIVKLITTSIKLAYWKKTGIPGSALIGTQKGVSPKRKGKKVISTDYLYDLTVTWGDSKLTTIYTESVEKDKPSKLIPGNQFPILWLEKEERYIDVPTVKAQIKEYLIAIPVCIAVLVGCFLLLYFLS